MQIYIFILYTTFIVLNYIVIFKLPCLFMCSKRFELRNVVGRFSRAPQIQSSNLLTEMENVITDDQNWYSKQPSQH